MKEISYQVQGSAEMPYNITIRLDGTNLSCLCDCPAGLRRTHCKHWMSVFEGKKQNYIGIDEHQLHEIRSWLTGSDIEEVWKELTEIKRLELEITAAKKKIHSALKVVMID